MYCTSIRFWIIWDTHLLRYNIIKQAQGLNTIITTAQKFFSSNHRIFIKASGNKVIGYVKTGVKKLFIRDQFTNFHEISPLCVLDFYVHESEQRNGHGKVKIDNIRNYLNQCSCLKKSNRENLHTTDHLLSFLDS